MLFNKESKDQRIIAPENKEQARLLIGKLRVAFEPVIQKAKENGVDIVTSLDPDFTGLDLRDVRIGFTVQKKDNFSPLDPGPKGTVQDIKIADVYHDVGGVIVSIEKIITKNIGKKSSFEKKLEIFLSIGARMLDGRDPMLVPEPNEFKERRVAGYIFYLTFVPGNPKKGAVWATAKNAFYTVQHRYPYVKEDTLGYAAITTHNSIEECVGYLETMIADFLQKVAAAESEREFIELAKGKLVKGK